MSLLYKRTPLVISPQLAVRIGLNEAVVLQQICYWLEETSAGVQLPISCGEFHFEMVGGAQHEAI